MIGGRRGKLALGGGLCTALTLLAGAFGPATADAAGSASAPGVTSNQIVVGSLATVTGPLSSGFADIVYGVRAYFDMVNAQGGVDGRKLVLKDVANDSGSPTDDTVQARDLVEQDHVFAVVGVGTPFFTASSYLGQAGTPTFGYVVSQNWAGPSDLFGTYGSVLDFSTDRGTAEWAAGKLGVKTAAVVAYNGVAQSQGACKSAAQGLQSVGVSVPVQDYSFGLGGNPDADVSKMFASHVQLLITCMEGPDNLSFAKAMKQYGLSSAYSIWLNGYSRAVAAQNAAAMQHVIFYIQHVPFEAAASFPSKYPAMVQYLKEMKKYEPAWVYDDVSFQGWVNAAQFVQGLRAVGKKTLTQKALVSAVNKETGFTAGGLIAPVDWTKSHARAVPPFCGSYAEVGPAGQLELDTTLIQPDEQVLDCFNGTTDVPLKSP